MPLSDRKARPLARDQQQFRDDRLFIVACDDTYAPKQYFDFFKIPRIHVHVVESTGGENAAEHVLDRLLQYEHLGDDERWLLLDTDHYTQGAHLQSFTLALTRARQNGIRVALSKHCFELWLLLHHIAETQLPALNNCAETDEALRTALGGQYNKTRLDPEKFSLSSVVLACERAHRLDTAVGGGNIPAGQTTRVYKIWHAMREKSLPSQLPEELRRLVVPQGE
jgi:RloB-like protein